MPLQPFSDWQAHIADGRQYLQTALRGRRRPAVFNNELIFQLAAMGIEKLVVGLSQYHRQMPLDHTLSGLVAELAAVCPLDAALADRIRHIDAMEDMCALTVEHHQPPEDALIREILAVGQEVEHFVSRRVSPNGASPATA